MPPYEGSELQRGYNAATADLERYQTLVDLYDERLKNALRKLIRAQKFMDKVQAKAEELGVELK